MLSSLSLLLSVVMELSLEKFVVHMYTYICNGRSAHTKMDMKTDKKIDIDK